MRSARGLALLCGFLKNDEWVLTLSWGSKRIDTKVSILLGLQFPLFLSLAKIGERRPLRKRGTAENLFTVGAHIVRLFSVLHKQNYVSMAIFHKQGTTNFVKNRLCGKILFSV